MRTQVRQTLAISILASAAGCSSDQKSAELQPGPATGNWEASFPMVAQGDTHTQVAVWNGGEVLFWDGIFSGLSRFRAETLEWTRAAPPPSTQMRIDASAVWTGKYVMLWGGVGCQPAHAALASCNTGAVYEPDSDSWRATTTIAALSGRKNAVAGWSGTEVLIWGGVDGQTYLEDGARYDPEADRWRPMAASPLGAIVAPATTMVGQRLFVWGGQHQDSSLTDVGAFYDSTTDSWSPVATRGAPSARGGASAVATDREIILWGGADAGGLLGDGAAYDLQTDTWRSISSLHAPAPRFDHTAVWTGESMIVWSGLGTDGGDRNDGAIYFPRTDTWIRMNTDGAPPPRRAGWCFWDGSRMLAFGGTVGGDGAYAVNGAFFRP